MDHPSDDSLARFFVGGTSRQENRQIVRHLLTQCEDCKATLIQIMQPAASSDYDSIFDRCAAHLRDSSQKIHFLRGSGSSGTTS